MEVDGARSASDLERADRRFSPLLPWSIVALAVGYAAAIGAVIDIALEDQVDLLPPLSLVLAALALIALAAGLVLGVLILARRRFLFGGIVLALAILAVPAITVVDAVVLSAVS